MAKLFFYFVVLVAALIDWRLIIIIILLNIIWRRLYRKRVVPSGKKTGFYSPVQGKVIQVVKYDSAWFIKIRVGILDHKGIYAMSSGEVDTVEVNENGKVAWSRTAIKKLIIRKKYRALSIKYLCNQKLVATYVMHGLSKVIPSTLLMPGDRVSTGANVGWMYLSGVIMVELPLDVVPRVQRGDKVKYFTTCIAGA